MGDVLGAEDAGLEPAREGGARGGAVKLEQRVEALDSSHPDARAARRQFGEVLVRHRSQLKQVLALEVALPLRVSISGFGISMTQAELKR